MHTLRDVMPWARALQGTLWVREPCQNTKGIQRPSRGAQVLAYGLRKRVRASTLQDCKNCKRIRAVKPHTYTRK